MNILTKCIIAEGMAELVERDYRKSKKVYSATLQDLRDIFGDVPPEDKAEVYEIFLEYLEATKTPFDKQLVSF